MGLKLVVDFPNGPNPYHLGLPSPVFWPNCRFCLVQGLNVPRPTPWAPFLKPSFVGTYAARESTKSKVEPNPTLRLVTQATMGAAS
jgi:hypothetical protein